MNIQTVLLTTPGRKASSYEAATAQLEAQGVPYVLHVDNPKGLLPRNEWRGVRDAWGLRIPEGVTHRLVLQDDVRLCRDFGARLNAAVLERPWEAISLYANRRALRAAWERSRPRPTWADLRDWRNSQGVLLPVEQVPRFLAYADALRSEDPEVGPYDDTRLMAWLRSESRAMCCRVPCLLQHTRPADSVTPHMNNRTRVTGAFWDDLEATLEENP